MSALFGVPVDAAYHLVLALTTILTPVLGGLAAAAGVVLLTMAVRLLVMPLSFRALRGQAAQARLAPRLAELRQRYGRQPERLQRGLTALYAKEGTSMLAGLWPVLAQWPVFSVLYLLFRSASVAGGPNRLLSHDLLGVPLGGHWLAAGAGALSVHGAVFIGMLAILAAACWLSARVSRRMLPAAVGTQTGPATPRAVAAQPRMVATKPKAVGTRPKSASGPSGGPAPAASGAIGSLARVLPYVTVVIAAFAPLAAGIYLITTVAWSTAEREVFRRANA